MSYQTLCSKSFTNVKVGDLVYVDTGAKLESITDNEESWNERPSLGIVIGITNRYVECEYESDALSRLVIVFISNKKLYKVPEISLVLVV